MSRQSLPQKIPSSSHLGAGAALSGSTSCQRLGEGIGEITGSEREIEVYAGSLGERFYCSYGTGLKGIRVQEKIFKGEPATPVEKLLCFQKKPRRLFLAFLFHLLPVSGFALQRTS